MLERLFMLDGKLAGRLKWIENDAVFDPNFSIKR